LTGIIGLLLAKSTLFIIISPLFVPYFLDVHPAAPRTPVFILQFPFLSREGLFEFFQAVQTDAALGNDPAANPAPVNTADTIPVHLQAAFPQKAQDLFPFHPRLLVKFLDIGAGMAAQVLPHPVKIPFILFPAFGAEIPTHIDEHFPTTATVPDFHLQPTSLLVHLVYHSHRHHIDRLSPAFKESGSTPGGRTPGGKDVIDQKKGFTLQAAVPSGKGSPQYFLPLPAGEAAGRGRRKFAHQGMIIYRLL
jgi:hypothetical protein